VSEIVHFGYTETVTLKPIECNLRGRVDTNRWGQKGLKGQKARWISLTLGLLECITIIIAGWPEEATALSLSCGCLGCRHFSAKSKLLFAAVYMLTRVESEGSEHLQNLLHVDAGNDEAI
jgi:hypothetical protein